MLVATRKGLLRFDADLELEAADFQGIPVSRAVEVQGEVFAALDHGHWGQKLHRLRGEEWTELEAPKFPEGIEASVDYLWEIADGRVPGRLWIGTNPGALFRSDDAGDTWVLCQSLWDHPSRGDWFGGGRDTPGIHSICVDPRDPERIWVGISCGGVFESTDGGASWEVRTEGLMADFLPDPSAAIGQDPHRVLQSEADPDVFWQQNHCGIWRSGDACRSWHEVSEAFGFGLAIHPEDADTAWFVPAISDEERRAVDGAMCVRVTRDGGRSFEELREGLPQALCYDLVYRHALAIRGRTLAIGSTTGNLWISQEEGATWRALCHHLPPIYSVDFRRR